MVLFLTRSKNKLKYLNYSILTLLIKVKCSKIIIVEKIQDYINQYLKWRKENKATELADREKRVRWYKEKFGSPKKIKQLTLENLHELLEKLWALNFWKNKRYKVNKLLKDNGLENLKEAFIDLLFSKHPIEKRWDDFRKHIKGLGSSSISEILTLVHPDQFGILNTKSITILPFLGYLSESEVKKISYGYTSGKDYKRFMNALNVLRKDLRRYGLPRADFIDVDFFIWYLFEPYLKLTGKRNKEEILKSLLGKESKETKAKHINKSFKKITSHQEAELILLKLGVFLGYDTYSPDKSKTAYDKKLSEYTTLKEIPQFTTPTLLDTIKNIDVIWFQDEFPICCFEVEHTTGVRNGLLRLYQTSQLNTKLFIIAPEDVLKKFETEMNKIPFSKIRHRYIFRSYKELIEFYQLAKEYHLAKKGFF